MVFRRPVHPSKSHEIKERRLLVSKYYKQRFKQYEIAEILGVDRSTIARDIQAIHREWQAQCIDNVHVVRIRELADLEDMEKICMERLEELEKNPHQGSRWMEERRKIKERRSKMLGLDTEQRYVIKKEITVVDKTKRDEILLAALGSRLPPGMTLEDVQKKLDAPERIPNAEYSEE
jgi:transposase